MFASMKLRLPGAKKLSGCIKPMLASSAKVPFDDPDYIYELKYDGFRAIAEVGTEVKLYSRNGTSFLKAYPKIITALSKITTPVILDGEIVVVDATGKPDFNGLQNYSTTSSATLLYYVFDCLSLNGKDMRTKPLLERKLMLRSLFDCTGTIRYCEHLEEQGISLFSQAAELGLEGIIAKKANSTYLDGNRSSHWIKIKNYQTKDFWIVGYGAKEFSLILGEIVEGQLVYRGEVGTGWNFKTRTTLLRLLNASSTDKPFISNPPKVPAQWVMPQFTCKVKFLELTATGSVRHPVFIKLN
jgi:bifunctional non-homologous end joining protein LigD